MKKKEEERKASFVRLTKLDGSPIWLNASFVVTIEPRKGGGSVVVPIGDGLDYDVRETPEAVLAYLDGAPVPDVVPVPTSDALTPTPEDVSPDDGGGYDAGEPGGKSAHRPEAHSRGGADDEPVRATRPAAAESARSTPGIAPGPGAQGAGELLEAEVARIRKMAPRTMKKLQNTIMTQFRAANTEAAIAALVSRGIIVIDGTRINWQQPEAAVKIEVSAPPAEEPPPGPADTCPPPEEEPPEEAETPPPQDEPKKVKRKSATTKTKKTAKKAKDK